MANKSLEKSFQESSSKIEGSQEEIAEYKKDFLSFKDKVRTLLKELNPDRDFQALISHQLFTNSRWTLQEEIDFLLEKIREVHQFSTGKEEEINELLRAKNGLLIKCNQYRKDIAFQTGLLGQSEKEAKKYLEERDREREKKQTNSNSKERKQED